MLIDAHTHLDHYQAEWPAALAEIQAQQILSISVAVDLPSYLRTKALAVASPWIIPTFGIHPWQAHRYAGQLSALDAYIIESPMLGEIGLDYVWDEDPAHYPLQRTVFEYFLAAAKAQNKSVNLHTKGAEQEILDLLRRYDVTRALIHWYSGPLDVLDKLIDHGCYFTIGVEVLVSPQIQTIAQRVPLARLLTETDNPSGQQWLTGELGLPHLTQTVLTYLAALKKLKASDLMATIQENFQRLAPEVALPRVSNTGHDETRTDEQARI
ncbi:MAG: TatD family hydrolase [Chloroflexi bacterium]|nr:TatD family hydrolase [Chloroflexota bacterium]